MKIKFFNENTKPVLVEFDHKKIATDYLNENKDNRDAVINDLSFGGFYEEDLVSYIENLLEEYAKNTGYSYDYEDSEKLIDEVKEHIIR